MQCTYKKRSNSLNNIQEHFVYNIRCENNNKVYIRQSIDPYKRFKQHMHRPPKKMKHDIDMIKTINLTSLLEILSFATSHYATGMQMVVVCNYLSHICNYNFSIV
jgi:predicted GIY-YIG superfamily endonuclease